MNSMIQVVLADDLPMFRDGMYLLLERQKELKIIAEAGNGEELIERVREHQPDVVITDIEMPVMNGIEATRNIKKEFPNIGVIALTMYGDDYLIEDMLEAGANGYLLKNTTLEELVMAVTTVKEGHPYFCNSTSFRLSKMIARNKILQDQKKADFSEKELEIIRLICEQYVSKEIADKTSLTHRTVEKYRDHIMQKTGSRNVVGIVIYAIKHGIYKT